MSIPGTQHVIILRDRIHSADFSVYGEALDGCVMCATGQQHFVFPVRRENFDFAVRRSNDKLLCGNNYCSDDGAAGGGKASLEHEAVVAVVSLPDLHMVAEQT